MSVPICSVPICGGGGGIFNLGSGDGYSVRAMVEAARKRSERMAGRLLLGETEEQGGGFRGGGHGGGR